MVKTVLMVLGQSKLIGLNQHLKRIQTGLVGTTEAGGHLNQIPDFLRRGAKFLNPLNELDCRAEDQLASQMNHSFLLSSMVSVKAGSLTMMAASAQSADSAPLASLVW